MLVVIDESGCPGFKLQSGSSAYFVIGMVIFRDLQAAEKISREIAELRETLKVKPEFKFSKTHRLIKDKFFQTICKHDFKVRALVVDKKKIYSVHLRTNEESFYSYFVRLLIEHDGGCLKEASIKIDGSGDKEFKQALKNYLMKNIRNTKIKNFKFVDSHRDNLVQLADMVVGAIARSYNFDRSDSTKWLDTLRISKKISDIWEYGKEKSNLGVPVS